MCWRAPGRRLINGWRRYSSSICPTLLTSLQSPRICSASTKKRTRKTAVSHITCSEVLLCALANPNPNNPNCLHDCTRSGLCATFVNQAADYAIRMGKHSVKMKEKDGKITNLCPEFAVTFWLRYNSLMVGGSQICSTHHIYVSLSTYMFHTPPMLCTPGW